MIQAEDLRIHLGCSFRWINVPWIQPDATLWTIMFQVGKIDAHARCMFSLCTADVKALEVFLHSAISTSSDRLLNLGL